MHVYLVTLPLLALLLDSILRDPRSIPHPVQGIGWLLDRLEAVARSCGGGVGMGALSLLASVLCVSTIVWAGISLPVLGAVFALYAAWAGLALGSLLGECQRAAKAIETGEEEGRQAMAMLVSRDTSCLDQPALYRALAETLSENLNDGVVAPFFWLCAGGPVGLWAYKTVSTMDSMWGYHTEKWERLGKAGAIIDDVLAYVPARITMMALLVTSHWSYGRKTGHASVCIDFGFTEGSKHQHAANGARNAGNYSSLLVRLQGIAHFWRTIVLHIAQDARKMESPNAGWPMAAAAWLHGRHMGGRSVYFGKIKEKPVLGPVPEEETDILLWDADSIQGLLRHCRVASYVAALLVWGFFAFF